MNNRSVSNTAASNSAGSQDFEDDIVVPVRDESSSHLTGQHFGSEARLNENPNDCRCADDSYSPFAAFNTEDLLPLHWHEPQNDPPIWETPPILPSSGSSTDAEDMDIEHAANLDEDVVFTLDQQRTAPNAGAALRHPPVRLLDLPDDILLHIISLCSTRCRSNDPNHQYDVPVGLDEIFYTCPRLRELFSTFCEHLAFEPLSNWEYVNYWFEIATPGLKSVRFHDLPTDDEDEIRWRSLPACFFFALISEHAPRLQRLDLSGVHPITVVDSRLLGDLLHKLRETLTTLVVKASEADEYNYLSGAVVAGSLRRLVEFRVKWLPRQHKKDLREMLESFRYEPNRNAKIHSIVRKGGPWKTLQPGLRRIQVQVSASEPDRRQTVPLFGPLDWVSLHGVGVEELQLSVQQARTVDKDPLPLGLIHCFPDLRVLSLEGFAIGNSELVQILARSRKLDDLRISNCKLQESELDRLVWPLESSKVFSEFIRICGNHLRVFKSRDRSFNAADLELLKYYHPLLTELHVVLARTSGVAFRELCIAMKDTLSLVGVYGSNSDEIQPITMKDREEIVAALRHLPLSSFQSSHIDLSTANFQAIIANASATLRVLRVQTNFKDCARNQLRCVLTVLLAATGCKDLREIVIDSHSVHKTRLSSMFGMLIMTTLKQLRRTAPKLRAHSLETILRTWIDDHETEGPRSLD